MAAKPAVLAVKVPLKDVVTLEALRRVGLNTQASAFGGITDPSILYNKMITNDPGVYPFYRDLEEKDTAISSALEVRKRLVMSRPAHVQSANKASAEAMRFAEGLAEFMFKIDRLDWVKEETLDSIGYGFSVAELFWEPDGTALKDIQFMPQELFRFGKFTETQSGGLLISSSGASGLSSGNFIPAPAFKFMVATHKPRHGLKLGRPLLRRVFWASWFKRNALKLHLQYLEKGNGTIAIEFNESASDEERKKALEAAEAIANEIAVAIPGTIKIVKELLGQTRIREGTDFVDLSDHMNAEITRTILGQTLATRGNEQGVGTQALGKVHFATMVNVMVADSFELEHAINDGLAAPFLLFNFGPRALEPDVRPWWTINKKANADRESTVAFLQEAKALGLEIPEEFAREETEIPAPENDEPILPASSPIAVSPNSNLPSDTDLPDDDDQIIEPEMVFASTRSVSNFFVIRNGRPIDKGNRAPTSSILKEPTGNQKKFAIIRGFNDGRKTVNQVSGTRSQVLRKARGIADGPSSPDIRIIIVGRRMGSAQGLPLFKEVIAYIPDPE